jgi:sugar phosphate isomerase/epimerase
MSHRLGINTCFAVKRWPRPDEWADIVRGELGLDLVQHSLDLVDLSADEAAADVREACARAGLTLGSTFTGLAAYSWSLLLDPDEAARRRAREWYSRVIAFSAQAGASSAGGHVGSLSTRDFADPGRRGALLGELRATVAELGAEARAAGLDAILFENMACAREPSTIEGARALLCDGVRLCLDVGHMCVPGTSGDDRDPYAWLRALGREAEIIHLQQSDADGDHHWPFTAAYQGRIEPARVLEALEQGGAGDVDLVLEVIHPFEAEERQVLEDLRESVEVWRAALAA